MNWPYFEKQRQTKSKNAQAVPTQQFSLSVSICLPAGTQNFFLERGSVSIIWFFLIIKKNMGISQETILSRNVLNIMQHFPKIFSTINPAERCPRWQNRIITSLVCFVFFVKKKYTFPIKNISFFKKHCKNCECCPGHYLIVNHYSSISCVKFHNLSAIVNCVT